ncbi:MAG: hypothetical protein IJF66_04235 [Clostridia bacterium]|nr:hypothetical protein [Clostridia bacterium]
MKNKLYVILLLALIAVSCILLCGCNHKHSFGEWQIETPPTCTQPGTKVSYCSCGDKQIAPVGPTHQFDSKTGRCIVCNEKCNHKYNAQGTCTYCGFINKNYCTDHIWDSEYGYCLNCGEYCSHKFDNNYHCEVCDFTCSHSYWTGGICNTCGKQCVHEWSSENEECAICKTKCDHQFSDSGLCSVCNHQCPHNNWSLGVCDKCSMVCSHDRYAYGVCYMCNVAMDSQLKQNCTHKFEKGLCTICGTQDASASTSKTYNLAESSLPVSWNVLDQQGELDQLVTTYTEDSLYVFDYNENKTGYQIVPAMALSMPVEVPLTAELAQKWGFEADEKGNYPQHHIWKIPLRTDLKFDNGDAITAHSFVESAIRLLDPKAANYRADSLYNGSMVIRNAEYYLKSGSTIHIPAYKVFSDFIKKNSEFASDIVFDIEHSYIAEYIVKEGYGTAAYLNAYGGWTGLASALWGIWDKADLDALTGKTWEEISASEQLTATWKEVITPWQTDPDEELHFFSTEYVYPQVKWEDVGLYAIDDYTLVVVLDNPLVGYELLSNLNLPLVHTEIYDSCGKVVDGVYTNNYGTSVDTYVGFGPYKLVTFDTKKIAQFVKNDLWYGYLVDNKHDSSIYEATSVVIKKVADEQSRLQMFLRGEIDSYVLQKEDMNNYQSSSYITYTPSNTIWYMVTNPDFEGLQKAQDWAEPRNKGYEVNKTVLSIKEFRQALTYSFNRARFFLDIKNAGENTEQLMFSIFNDAVISDKENGTVYRSTEQAKDVVLAYWDLADDVCTSSCTEGCTAHRFATKDDALSSITGYDVEYAKEYFNKAYDIAVEKQLISADALASGKWEVQIMIGVPGIGSSTYYNTGYEFIKQCWSQAVEGTKFEGHLTFMQAAPLGGYWDYIKNNYEDLMFGTGVTNSALDPFGTLEAFIDPSYERKCDTTWDTLTEKLVIELPLDQQGNYHVDGALTAVTGTVYDWYKAVNGETKIFAVGDGSKTIELNAGEGADSQLRLTILSKLENEILQQYNIIPTSTYATAQLISHRTSNETSQYVHGVGFGGLKYLDFAMTDGEWAQAVANNGGSWDYSK